ncbi:methyltransferase domain-containing protein [Nocardia sp. SYP-A9097]|uniref:class I SAM-dependent methyltransferase n=1 Tax=Nocardia sp. SYP-A9097 TaxID=2663237 RepID=UPI00129BF802|nr:class I SAM-dependent methyltransferase [Nocardia sp. SYP-A9097]MRH90171.1 methyltransferase domain-containing protein [Nocardia sp. SYP-A9097]
MATETDEQNTRWNGRSGQVWAQSQGLLDQVMKPLEELLVQPVLAGSGARILDVGCGGGATTLAAAHRVGTPGSCVGVDISAPMIDAARAHAQDSDLPVSFLLGDAQTYVFEPASFDLIMSRFGVMFFPDPVAAFTNLRAAARPGAALRMLVWRGVRENPFMTTAERAAAPLLPNLLAREPNQPGQFAFADDQRVRTILTESGWGDIRVHRADVECVMPEDALIHYFTNFGPVGLALPDTDEQTRARVIEVVRAAFDPFVHGDQVRYTAACWMVEAHA